MLPEVSWSLVVSLPTSRYSIGFGAGLTASSLTTVALSRTALRTRLPGLAAASLALRARLAHFELSVVGFRFSNESARRLVARSFRERPPTAENLARTLFELIDDALPGLLLQRVRLRPTPDLCVEVSR